MGRLLVSWLVGSLALAVSAKLLPGLQIDGVWPAVAAAAIAGVGGVVVRPVMVYVAARIGWVALALLALAGQAVIVQLSLLVVPGVTVESFWTSLAAAWLTAGVSTLLMWLGTTGTPESLVMSLARGRHRRARVDDPEIEGMVFVQLDGVPYPVMLFALQAGLMPTVRRWIDDGSHLLREWTVQLPCTTPASQLGILHGEVADVPAFRWYDRDVGRVLVANRPADARIIEERASTGAGLLADGGVSVSNLFSGDAVRSAMVMSKAGLSRGSLETRRVVGWFLARPDGLARSVHRALAEIFRERHQARRQRRRDVVPRIVRPWEFTGLRAVTNGLLRDLNTAVVAAEMLSGTRSVYVDYVDFDEVAHHAGAVRIESLAVLAQLDEVVSVLERLAAMAPRRYRLVLLSDHGQSMGATFKDRYGEDLADLCRSLMSTDVVWVGEAVESWGRAGSIAEDLVGAEGAAGAEGAEGAAGAAGPDGPDGSEGGTAAGDGLASSVARRTRRAQEVEGSAPGPGAPVVLGSGNLGLVYADRDRRLTLADLEQRWPRLVPGLVGSAGVGFVAGVDERGEGVVVGPHGRRSLESGAVQGQDPLDAFPPHAAHMLSAALASPRAPDLYVNSAVDPSTGEVAAFEELVGSHGGLGGWQDQGMVVAPTDLWPATERLVGAPALHAALVAMLEALGHRTGLSAGSAGSGS